jgi:hypothetical protein
MGLQEQLYKRWILSEQQEGGIKVYQKIDSSKKGDVEEGFEIKPNGEFVKYGKSFSGRPMKITGRVQMDGNTVYAYFNDPYLDSMFTVLSVDENTLKVR